MEKLNRTQKCSILGPQSLGSRGGAWAPGPPWIRTKFFQFHAGFKEIWQYRMLASPPWKVGSPTLGKSWIRH